MENRVLTLPENTKGRDFVVGDLHGCFDELEEALKAVKFNPKKDRLFAVGDLINRGPKSAKALSYLQQSWFYATKGNHEDEYSRRLHEIASLKNGYNMMAKWVNKTPQKTIKAIEKKLKNLPILIEVETKRGNIGIVHATVPEGLTWKELKKKVQSGNQKIVCEALYGRNKVSNRSSKKVQGIHQVFSGHTIVPSPTKLANHFFIETGVYTRYVPKKGSPKGYLTLIEIGASTKDICSPRKVNPRVRIATRRPS